MAVKFLFVVVALSLSGVASAQDGATLYKELCSSCHDAAVDRAPSREALRAMARSGSSTRWRRGRWWR
jgi:cytochrome c5